MVAKLSDLVGFRVILVTFWIDVIPCRDDVRCRVAREIHLDGQFGILTSARILLDLADTKPSEDSGECKS